MCLPNKRKHCLNMQSFGAHMQHHRLMVCYSVTKCLCIVAKRNVYNPEWNGTEAALFGCECGIQCSEIAINSCLDMCVTSRPI